MSLLFVLVVKAQASPLSPRRESRLAHYLCLCKRKVSPEWAQRSQRCLVFLLVVVAQAKIHCCAKGWSQPSLTKTQIYREDSDDIVTREALKYRHKLKEKNVFWLHLSYSFSSLSLSQPLSRRVEASGSSFEPS